MEKVSGDMDISSTERTGKNRLGVMLLWYVKKDTESHTPERGRSLKKFNLLHGNVVGGNSQHFVNCCEV